MNEVVISFIFISIYIIIYFFFKLYNNKTKRKDDILINKEILSKLNIVPFSFTKTPFKRHNEEDHVISFLFLKNKDFLSGQMNGMISYYSGKTYQAILLIIEHCAPITSLSQLNDETILTSSAEGTMKKIKILLNEGKKKRYLVEFVFYTNKEFIFKSIQLKNNDDILSCDITKELLLWKKKQNNDYPLYKVEKVLLNNEYVRDILQINENIFITCGENIQCWNTQTYELMKKLSYNCKGNNSLYKINDDYTAILLQKDGDILLFNNKTLSEIKIFTISSFSLTCIKPLSNNIIAVGIFDNKNKKSIINQYLFNNKVKENQENGNEIEFIKVKEENIDKENYLISKNEWERINIIEEMGNKIFLGFGGQKDMKYFGKIIILEN